MSSHRAWDPDFAPPAEPKARIISSEEAAYRLGFTDGQGVPNLKSLHHHRRKGRIPFTYVPGTNLIRFRECDIDELVENALPRRTTRKKEAK